jgi:hypothetical protein
MPASGLTAARARGPGENCDREHRDGLLHDARIGSGAQRLDMARWRSNRTFRTPSPLHLFDANTPTWARHCDRR